MWIEFYKKNKIIFPLRVFVIIKAGGVYKKAPV